jgi:hypothetical protein
MRLFLYENMLLFSVRRERFSLAWELFFVAAETLIQPEPAICRFYRSPVGGISRLHLGSVYDLEVSASGMVRSAAYTRTEELEPPLCLKLASERNRIFAGFPELSGPDMLYPLEEADALLHFRESFFPYLLKYALLAVVSAFCVIIPFVVYILAIMLSAAGLSSGEAGSGSLLRVPLVAVGALPLIIFLIVFLLHLSGRALQRVSLMHAFLARRSSLAAGGVRPVISKHALSARTFRLGAIACGSVLVFCIILSFILGAVM